MRSESWWPWLAVTLLVLGCGRTQSNCQLCATEPVADAGRASGGNGGATGGNAAGGASPNGGVAPVGGQPNQGGAPLLDCAYGPPAAPLVPYSQVDLEWTMDDVIGPGPSFLPAFEARSDAGPVRPVFAGFVRQLQSLASARVDALSLDEAPLTLCEANVQDRSACVDSWIREHGLRIYRRPLTDAQLAGYVGRFSEQAVASSPEAAARTTLLSMLLSPYFVYRIELGVPLTKALTIWPPNGGAPVPPGGAPVPLPSRGNALSSYEVAARLSHFAWRSGPDTALLSQAAAGQLQSPDEVLAAFDRLLADPRSWRARTLQQLEWLHLEQWGELEPQDPSELAPLQREQTARFIGELLQRSGSFTELLTSPRQPLNQALAQQMGIDVALGEDFEPVELDAALYAGVLGQGAWLSRSPRPTQRGLHLLSQLLCSEVPPPPPNVPPGLGTGSTPRERITNATAINPVCAGCHQIMDPPGFALEAFDEQGRLTGFDTTGKLRLPNAGEVELAGPRELGQAIATSRDAKVCAAQRAVEYLVQARLTDSTDQALLSCLVQSVGDNDLSLNQLARQIAVSDAMSRTRREPSSAVGVGDAADPLQHAIEETRGLILGLSQEEGLPLQQYLLALQELQAAPPLP